MIRLILMASALVAAQAVPIGADAAQRRDVSSKALKKAASLRGIRSNVAGSRAVYFANCSAARAAGAAPVRLGDPGYARKLDRDGDGVGCE